MSREERVEKERVEKDCEKNKSASRKERVVGVHIEKRE